MATDPSEMARDRIFMKAIRRLRGKLQPLFEAFERVEMVNPIHQAILVGNTDEAGPDFFEEVESDDGFFQLLSGCTTTANDELFAQSVLKPSFVLQGHAFFVSDSAQFDRAFEGHRSTNAA